MSTWSKLDQFTYFKQCCVIGSQARGCVETAEKQIFDSSRPVQTPDIYAQAIQDAIRNMKTATNYSEAGVKREVRALLRKHKFSGDFESAADLSRYASEYRRIRSHCSSTQAMVHSIGTSPEVSVEAGDERTNMLENLQSELYDLVTDAPTFDLNKTIVEQVLKIIESKSEKLAFKKNQNILNVDESPDGSSPGSVDAFAVHAIQSNKRFCWICEIPDKHDTSFCPLNPRGRMYNPQSVEKVLLARESEKEKLKDGAKSKTLNKGCNSGFFLGGCSKGSDCKFTHLDKDKGAGGK